MAHLGEDLRSAGTRGATADDSDTDRPVERHVDVSDRAAALLRAGQPPATKLKDDDGRRDSMVRHAVQLARSTSTQLNSLVGAL